MMQFFLENCLNKNIINRILSHKFIQNTWSQAHVDKPPYTEGPLKSI